MFKNIYKNKKVLVLGHTGFKGSWLVNYFHFLGSNVYGISKNIITKPSHFKVSGIEKKIKNFKIDIRNKKKLEKKILQIKPDFIFHLAAQAIVKKSYEDPYETYSSNVIGTLNVLESINQLSKIKKIISVIITSDKCYENIETNIGYKESDRLGGKDIYSSSKASAEILFSSYYRTFFTNNKNIRIASARAGNVIGGGDWSVDRLIPDFARANSKNKVLKIRNINSTRPWQHILEILSGYLTLGYKLKMDKNINGKSYNFGPNRKPYTVDKILKLMKKHWEGLSWTKKKQNYKESKLLQLNVKKSMKELNWRPLLNIEATVKFTAEWYKEYYLTGKILTKNQISFFNNLLKVNK
jgi:CDP-glucose 4,6-dehydratase